MPQHISDTIGYTSLHSDSTTFPLNYHIRGNSLEFYVHRITFYVSCQCFVPQNYLLHPNCNIGTYAHLLLTKSPSSELQEFLGKLIFPIEFLQYHLIVILVWNEWFCWLHIICV